MDSIIEQNIDKIATLCRNNYVQRLFAFGSVTDPTRFRCDSDVDFLVSFDFENLSLEDYAESYFRLSFQLEDLLKRDVDLITDRSLSNPYFIAELESTKVEVFAHTEQEYGQ